LVSHSPAALGENARAAFIAAEQGQAILYIPSIVVAELYYVNVKLGQPLNFGQDFKGLPQQASFASLILRLLMSCSSMRY
jgi:predicted nucleic acid-binding protein